jgi:hypothetical protein
MSEWATIQPEASYAGRKIRSRKTAVFMGTDRFRDGDFPEFNLRGCPGETAAFRRNASAIDTRPSLACRISTSLT